MWVFMIDAMLSIVRHRDLPQFMMVRARLRGDIERVFPNATVVETPVADYRFRATIPAREVAMALAESAMNIHYENFKASVKDPHRHDAYMGVWSVMYREQVREMFSEAEGQKPERRPAAKRAKASKKRKRVRSSSS